MKDSPLEHEPRKKPVTREKLFRKKYVIPLSAAVVILLAFSLGVVSCSSYTFSDNAREAQKIADYRSPPG